MPYDYTSESESLQLVIDITEIDTPVKRLLIGQSLADSVGLGPLDVTYYRPYYVAARQLQRNRDDQTLTAADGAQFTNLTIMIRSLFEEQIALDESIPLVVPDAYSAQLALDKACGCAGGSAATTTAGNLGRGIMSIMVA
jgi:hypothetical protein